VSPRYEPMQGTLDFAAAVLEQLLVTETPAILEDSDAALVEASQHGDTQAFGQLYQRYARMVHGILLSRVHASEVEDLVQDVFLRALPRLRHLREASRFGAWIGSITRNMATDYHRRSQVLAQTRDDSAEPDALPAAGGASQSSEAAEILECIQSLPEAYRETLILRLVEGMNGPEIAARTGLGPGSVRVNLHRGMQQLRERLARRSMRLPNFENKAGEV
jgi:RNA polymerase sigma-70 factor (ECF subfamily)